MAKTSNRLTNIQLRDIQARRAGIGDKGWEMIGRTYVYEQGKQGRLIARCDDVDVADFIESAPSDIDLLIAECKALAEERDEARRIMDAYADDHLSQATKWVSKHGGRLSDPMYTRCSCDLCLQALSISEERLPR